MSDPLPFGSGTEGDEGAPEAGGRHGGGAGGAGRAAGAGPPAERIEGARVLVTGASGLVGMPLALDLVRRNEVVGLARFTDPGSRKVLDAAGVATLRADVAAVGPGDLPEVDYVVHAGAVLPSTGSERDRATTFEVNVQATGRLLRAYPDVRGFLYCGSGSCYAYQGRRPLREDDPYGLHNRIETYAASKIAAESLVTFLSREQSTPVTIVRIFTMYGPTSGTVTKRVDMVREGREVPVYPDGPNHQCPLFVDDAVRLLQRALVVADVPPTVVNLAGSETTSVQEYCTLAAQLLGTEARFREDPDAYYPIWPDVTRMHRLLGRCRTSVADGVAAVLASTERTRDNWIPGSGG